MAPYYVGRTATLPYDVKKVGPRARYRPRSVRVDDEPPSRTAATTRVGAPSSSPSADVAACGAASRVDLETCPLLATSRTEP
jgi:hypothetical protein